MVRPEETLPRRDVARPEWHDGESIASGEAPSSAGTVENALPRKARAARGAVKILFFSANAVSDKRLAVDAEYRAIEQSILSSRYREAFQLIPKLAAREGDLQQALLEHQPDIVHFACHGSAEAEVLLLAEDGGTAPVPAVALTSMFRVLRDNLALVVFNTCWSREQAAAIRQSAGLCIGMREPIGDAEAIKFAAGCYGALAYGRSVRDAFELGVAAIKTGDPRRRDVPQLFEAKGISAGDVAFVREVQRPRAPWTLAIYGGLLALTGWLWALRPGEVRISEDGNGDVLVVARAEQSLPLPGPPPDMVRFPGVILPPGQPGRLDRSLLLAACASAQATEECAESQPEAVAEIRVDAFDLDREEVTNRAFAAWLGAQADTWRISKYGVVQTRGTPLIPLVRIVPECGGGLIATSGGQVRAGADKGRWPVTCVTWRGANEYCRAQGKRLPLEIEWELAARGPEGRPFPWGSDLPRQDVVAFELGDGATPHPREVGSSPQDITPQGVRDLGGNVAEWVEDGREDLEQKTMRGGTWASIGPCHLLGSRCKRIPAESNQADVGFRCARNVMSHQTDRKDSP